MTLDDQVTAYLRIVPGGDAGQIAADMRAIGNRFAALAEVQHALHRLDDAGTVIMRGGWYRLSEAGKRGRAG
jgi:hypothetical protein